jgi:uncharacterized pyridoxal phosphate-dependent enzyme
MEPNIYEMLGVDSVINAAGNMTAVGGSRMSGYTMECMKQAAADYVDLAQLQQALHGRIAKMTRNEAAFICSGAASGLYLTLAACLSMKRNQPFADIPPEIVRHQEVILFAAHRNPYDHVVRQLGLKLKQVGYPNVIRPPGVEDLLQAVTEETVAVYYVAGSEQGWLPKGALSLQQIVPIAGARGVPVIVDAAAQLPPADNLWRFTAEGADAAVFSGGKDLAGPQASGLVVGKAKLLRRVNEIGFPNYGIGRIMKVGREEMVGLYAALEQYLSTDHAGRLLDCQRQMAALSAELKGSALFQVEIRPVNESGQPIPRGFVRILREDLLTPDRLTRQLMQGSPRIYTVTEGEPGIFVNPMTLRVEECSAVIRRLKEIERGLIG